MPQQIITVDAFTNKPFTGNPAAVCVVDEAIDDARMQLIAREMNYAETAFVRPSGAEYSLRWFTPTTEVELCGHATLAAAHVLWETGRLSASAVAAFDTRSGRLTAVRHGEWIELDFPTTPASPVPMPPGLQDILGAQILGVFKSKFDLLVELADAEAVRALSPDLSRLRNLPVRGGIVTAAGEGEVDFVSRFFAPQSGVDEDPVTGSAHCALGEFWQKRLGKSQLLARQVSPRGGTIKVMVHGERTHLFGQAVTILTGELRA